MNAGSTEGGNPAPAQFGAAFGRDPPLASPCGRSLAGSEHGRVRGVVSVARDRHARSDQPSAERRCKGRSSHKSDLSTVEEDEEEETKKTQKAKSKTQMERKELGLDWILLI